jgi:hypothetical protein
MQQLFAIDPFRNMLLGLSAGDDFMRELSDLFLLLSESIAKFVSTEKFVDHYSLYGNPLNRHKQQDAIEILQDLLSRFDGNPIVDALFAGTMQQNILADDVNESSVDKFTTLDLEIEKSLEKFFARRTRAVAQTRD